MIRKYVYAALAIGVLAPLLVAQASAQSVADFYKGKRMTMIIASGAGGGYDTYARVLMRHLARHIPGKPKIIAQNMTGAAGLKATNFMANKAKRDGSIFMATYNSMSVQPLIRNAKVQFDPRTLNWIGSIGKLDNMCFTWHTSPIKTLNDAKKREVITSGTGAFSNATTVPNLLNYLTGTKFNPIIGYSTGGMRLAVERGEVEGICGLAYTTMMASNPDWITSGKLNILAQITRKRVPALGKAPMIYDFAKTADHKKILDLWTVPQELGRPFLMPPKVPADRLEAVRRAFDATMKDPKFLADAKKTHLFVDAITGERIHALIKDAYTTPQDIVKKTAKIINYAPFKKNLKKKKKKK
jgi:tripartite-type tricarboxylate transporter receptor subunit TctC